MDSEAQGLFFSVKKMGIVDWIKEGIIKEESIRGT